MSFAAASADHAPESLPESIVAAMQAVLRVMAARFIENFGDPAAMIKGGAIYGKARERILRWLHDMESVVRRLLLLRAALLPAPEPRAGAVHARANAMRRRKEGDTESLFGPAEDPAHWRVSFRMPTPPEPSWIYAKDLGGFRTHEDAYHLGHRIESNPMGPAASGAAANPAAMGYWVDDPRPLAERFEALQRIIDDPDHYAARLAQRLHGWRGRVERRQLFLNGLCAVTPIAYEAGLSDEEWRAFAEARPMARALIPVFSGALAPAVRDSS